MKLLSLILCLYNLLAGSYTLTVCILARNQMEPDKLKSALVLSFLAFVVAQLMYNNYKALSEKPNDNGDK